MKMYNRNEAAGNSPTQGATSPIEETGHAEQQNLDSPAAENTVESSIRTRRPPNWMRDYNSGEGLSDAEDEDEVRFAMYSSFGDPTSFEDASQDSKWMKAMEEEISAIEWNNTWELVNLPGGITPIGVKWVYKTKLNEEGKMDKFKARLVVKGYSQRKGVDYEEVFAPVARWDTIRTLLAISAQRNWKVFQLAVKTGRFH